MVWGDYPKIRGKSWNFPAKCTMHGSQRVRPPYREAKLNLLTIHCENKSWAAILRRSSDKVNESIIAIQSSKSV